MTIAFCLPPCSSEPLPSRPLHAIPGQQGARRSLSPWGLKPFRLRELCGCPSTARVTRPAWSVLGPAGRAPLTAPCRTQTWALLVPRNALRGFVQCLPLRSRRPLRHVGQMLAARRTEAPQAAYRARNGPRRLRRRLLPAGCAREASEASVRFWPRASAPQLR